MVNKYFPVSVIFTKPPSVHFLLAEGIPGLLWSGRNSLNVPKRCEAD